MDPKQTRRAPGAEARAVMTEPYVVEYDGKTFKGTDYAGELSRYIVEQNKDTKSPIGSVNIVTIAKTVGDDKKVTETEKVTEIVRDVNHRATLELAEIPGSGKRYRKYGTGDGTGGQAEAAVSSQAATEANAAEEEPGAEDEGTDEVAEEAMDDDTEARDGAPDGSDEAVEDFAEDAVQEGDEPPPAQ